MLPGSPTKVDVPSMARAFSSRSVSFMSAGGPPPVLAIEARFKRYFAFDLRANSLYV